MSNDVDYQRQQAQRDAQQGYGPKPDNAFKSDTERKAYNAEYNRNKK